MPPDGAAKVRAELQGALAADARRHYGIPAGVRITLGTLDILTELRTLSLSRATEAPEPNLTFLQYVARKIRDHLCGVDTRDLPYGSERAYLDRVALRLRVGGIEQGRARLAALPPLAQEEYRNLLRQAGWRTIFNPDPLPFSTGN